MSLQEQSIRRIRAELLGATTAADFMRLWNLATRAAGAGDTGKGDFQAQIQRDVIAYLILHILRSSVYIGTYKEPKVYGGFVAAHHSGKPWDDMDLFIDIIYANLQRLMQYCVQQIRFILDITHIRFKHEFKPPNRFNAKYASKCSITVWNSQSPIVIPIDVTIPWCTHYSSKVFSHGRVVDTPATLGSCLQIRLLPDETLHTEVRPDVNKLIEAYSIDSILRFLQNGEDIRFGLYMPPELLFDTKLSNYNRYITYFKGKIQKKHEQGWKLDAPPVGYPPGDNPYCKDPWSYKGRYKDEEESEESEEEPEQPEEEGGEDPYYDSYDPEETARYGDAPIHWDEVESENESDMPDEEFAARMREIQQTIFNKI